MCLDIIKAPILQIGLPVYQGCCIECLLATVQNADQDMASARVTYNNKSHTLVESHTVSHTITNFISTKTLKLREVSSVSLYMHRHRAIFTNPLYQATKSSHPVELLEGSSHT